jgi:hypothetical protein
MQTQTVTVTVEPVRTPRPTVLPTALPMLRVMDLAQAEAPRSMGELRSGIQAVSEAPQGVLDGAANQAYLVGWRIFRVIDISAPTRPRELISWGIDSLVAPALFGDRVLLSDSLRLRNLDLRTPMVPREAGSLELPPWRVADLQTVVPGRVAVALPDFGIRFLDLQHPAAPSEAATLPLSRLRAMRVLTGAGPPLMYLLDGADFVVVNPLDATTPREIGRLRLAQVSVNGNFGRNRLAVTGGIAVLAVESGGLLLVDVADPARPQLVGRYAGCIAEQVVALPSGFVATYCTNTSQLQLVDLRAPRQPRRAAIVGLAGWPMVAVGDFIYLLGSSEPVLDARDPRRPRLLDVDVSIGGMDGEVVGELLYTAGRDVRVYDIREPGAPRLLDTIVVPSLNGLDSNEQALAVDGDSLLVGDSIGTGLTVMVRSAASPEVPDATPTPTAPASASPSSTPVHATGSPSPGSTVTPSATLRPDRQRVVLPWTNRP